MDYSLPPHIRAAFVGQSVIILDLRADRYIRLGSGAADIFRSLRRNLALSEKQRPGADALAAGGLLSATCAGGSLSQALSNTATSSAIEQDCSPRRSFPGTLSCGLALLSANARLKFHGLERSLIDAGSRWLAVWPLTMAPPAAPSARSTLASTSTPDARASASASAMAPDQPTLC